MTDTPTPAPGLGPNLVCVRPGVWLHRRYLADTELVSAVTEAVAAIEANTDRYCLCQGIARHLGCELGAECICPIHHHSPAASSIGLDAPD